MNHRLTELSHVLSLQIIDLCAKAISIFCLFYHFWLGVLGYWHLPGVGMVRPRSVPSLVTGLCVPLDGGVRFTAIDRLAERSNLFVI
jgi:hypothetical protein